MLTNLHVYNASGLAQRMTDLVLWLPAPARQPVALPSEDVPALVGRYSNPVGESLEVVRGPDGLALRGELTCDLVPSGEASFGAADTPDITVRFEDRGRAA